MPGVLSKIINTVFGFAALNEETKLKTGKINYYRREGSKLGPLDKKVRVLPIELWKRRYIHVAI
jgi:hypothetical protein